MADRAARAVGFGVAFDIPQSGNDTIVDPATGALGGPVYLSPELAKTLRRAAKLLAFRLYLGHLRLEAHLIYLKLRYAMLSVRCYLLRQFLDLLKNRHTRLPKRNEP
jgi:hypothetical protein